jgi:hypothetical protein
MHLHTVYRWHFSARMRCSGKFVYTTLAATLPQTAPPQRLFLTRRLLGHRLLPSALPHDNERRVIVCYKDQTLDPLNNIQNERVTVNWRNDPVARPKDALIGQMWESWYSTGNFPWKAINTGLWPFQGTAMASPFPGSLVTNMTVCTMERRLFPPNTQLFRLRPACCDLVNRRFRLSLTTSL